jgi:hypothetical protein
MRGSIRKRGNMWVTVVDLGPDPQTGKRRQQKRRHPTEQAAEAYMTMMLNQLQAGEYIPPTKIRTGEFLERWLRDYAKPTVGRVTFATYEGVTRKTITPVLGGIPLRRLAPGHIQTSTRIWRPKAPSPPPCKRYTRCSIGLSRPRSNEGLIPRNPAALTTRPRLRRREVPIWDAEQLTLFLGRGQADEPGVSRIPLHSWYWPLPGGSPRPAVAGH